MSTPGDIKRAADAALRLRKRIERTKIVKEFLVHKMSACLQSSGIANIDRHVRIAVHMDMRQRKLVFSVQATTEHGTRLLKSCGML